MSWSEVKKINSDMSVPLDNLITKCSDKITERATYIDGLFPRDKKLLAYSTSGTSSKSRWLEITGSGIIVYASMAGAITSMGGSIGANTVIVVDDLTEYTLYSTVSYGSSSNTYITYENTIYDNFKYASNRIFNGGTFKTNEGIPFKKKFYVNYNITSANGSGLSMYSEIKLFLNT